MPVIEKAGLQKTSVRCSPDSKCQPAEALSVSCLVTAIIPCFNHSRHLGRAVSSVLAQRAISTEIIIVDDGSTDNTEEVARSFGNRVRYIQIPHSGLSAARNAGLQLSCGNFVHFLDADDYIAPTMYLQVMEVFARNANVDVVYTGFEVEKMGAVTMHRASPPTKHFVEELLVSNEFPFHSLVFNHKVLDCACGFDETLNACEDWDLLIRLAIAGATFACVADPLVTYVRRPDSLSTDYLKMLEGGNQVLGKQRETVQKEPGLNAAWRKGLLNLRPWFFGFSLAPQLLEFWRGRQLHRFFVTVIRVCVWDVRSLVQLLGWLSRGFARVFSRVFSYNGCAERQASVKNPGRVHRR